MAGLRLALALAALAAFASCAPYHRPRLSFAVEQRILRETTLDDAEEGRAQVGDGVVRLVRFGKASGACSGAVIGPRHVLTAEHCVVGHDGHGELTFAPILPGQMHVELGGDYLPWGRVGVREIHACEGYLGDLEHDVAVVVLSKPVPRDVPIFELSYAVPTEAAIYELAGFGTDDKPKTAHDWGPLISATRHVHSGPVRAVNDERIILELPGMPGDSGGPIVDVESGRVVSVVSRGRTRKDYAGESTDASPLVSGPRLANCKRTIDAALSR